MKFFIGEKVVAMADKFGHGRRHKTDYFGNMEYPALTTFGIVVDVTETEHYKSVHICTPSGDIVQYRQFELEPLEMLRKIFDEHRYKNALKQLNVGG